MNELKTLIDEEGDYRFSKGGRILNSRKLDSVRARRVKECALIYTELADVIHWLQELQKLTMETPQNVASKTVESEAIARLSRAYFTSACITYFKFFTHGHGMSVKVDANKLYSHQQLDIHNNIERLRHKLMAHIDSTDDFTHELFAIEDPIKEYCPSIVPVFFRTNHFNEEKLAEFIDLVTFLHDHFVKQYEQSGHSLMDEVFGSKSS
ncbi:hypothetical protein [Shewanella sp. MBTL60-112-B2]|nr:hypothetical protein [Shewanella sp. MBTL60-112-B2]GIU08196.1 hypothetical protein TUM4444_08800 [Shewanella sp. MBTL60-112-B1]GIU35072.1 hypothetical protein TUM4445_24430 [Shewanella sp. MBTL60-112-B2]